MTTNNNNAKIIDLIEVLNGNQNIEVTNTERLNRFLCFGGDVDSVNEYNETLLHEVAKSGDIETAKYLIEKGANVNAIDLEGETALMYAVRSNNKKMVKLLNDANADGFAKDFSGRDIFTIARDELITTNPSSSYFEMMQLLRSCLYAYN